MNAKPATVSQPERKGIALPLDIHKTVQQWSNSFFRPSIPTNLIDKSTVTEINDERAKLLAAQFLYGERNGKQKDIPYDGREFTNEITDKGVETLWLYGKAVPPPGFSEKSLNNFQIDTGKKRKCRQCRGSGKVPCSKCNGTRFLTKRINDKNQTVSCTCGDGKQTCHDCDGYGEVHTVIVVKTNFKVENSRKHDYNGQIPEKKLKNSSGRVVFEESVDYPQEKTIKLLQGGVNPAEYSRLQVNVSELFHSLIGKKLTDYDGDIKMVHNLVDDFLQKMPNACENNKLLEHEILPVRIGFKIEDAPVKRVSYTYKNKPYTLWVYGKEQRVYAKKRPLGFTGRLVVSWIVQLMIVGLVIYWFTGWPLNHASSNPAPVAATAVATSQPHAGFYDKTRQAAEQGNPESQSDLGLMYAKGDGVAKDPVEAVKWFTKAAERGFARAQNNLGVMYEDGNGVAKDNVEAVKWFRAAAEQGFARAQNNLATKYLAGEGVPRDPVEAVKWFRKSAEQGFPDGQYNLGTMYDNGDGTPKDPVEAAKWYRKAAEQGFARAESSLAVKYFNGKGVAKDLPEAINWFTKAAEQGLPDAQYNMGQMYNSGTGVPMNYIQAAKWFNLAAAQGDEDAKRAYSKLAEIMAPEKISQAQALAKQFVPRKTEP